MNGRLVRQGEDKIPAARLEDLIRFLLPPPQMARYREKGQVDLGYGIPQVGRFRVHVYRQRGSPCLAVRIIPTRIPSLEELGLPPQVAELVRQPHGLVLVTGPAGSGKSTTVAALIDLLNRERECHIVTLEDPIEYLHRHGKALVNQREIGIDAPSFPEALQAALREDPDVIVIGEMRDPETVSTALTAAETGHLVLATLHTADAAQTVERIIDGLPPHRQSLARAQLAGTLRGVVSQLLLPRADRQGRVVAAEILIATPAVRHLIREGKSHQLPGVIQAGGRLGMVTLETSLRSLSERGLISPEELGPWLSRRAGAPGTRTLGP